MKGLFQVIRKDSKQYSPSRNKYIYKIVDVYNVRDDKNGYPHFLICCNGE